MAMDLVFSTAYCLHSSCRQNIQHCRPARAGHASYSPGRPAGRFIDGGVRLELDENLGLRHAEMLRQACHEVDTVHDESLSGVGDDAVLAAARAADRVQPMSRDLYGMLVA